MTDLAFVTLCHWCEKTFVSALRPFSTPYVCVPCLVEHGPPTKEPWHGTAGGYARHACRCQDCKAAAAAKQRAYRASRRA